MDNKLQWQIRLYPILLILLTAITLTYVEIKAYKQDAKTVLDNTINTYIQNNKQSIKKQIFTLVDSLNYQITRNQNPQGISTQKIQEMVLDRRSKTTFTENYLFIYKLHNINGGKDFATMILNQNRPDLIGKKISDDYKDAKGKEFRKEFLEKIKKDGEGFVEYWYKKPNTDSIEHKISYFYHFKEWDWVLAKGFYFNSLDKELDRLKEQVHQRINDRIKSIVTLTFIISIFAIIISILLSKRILALITHFTKEIHQTEKKYSQKLEDTFEQAAVGIAHVSLEGRWIKVNKKLCTILGYSKDELLQLTFQEITYPDDLKKSLTKVEQILNGEIDTFTLDKRYRKKDGSYIWVRLTVSYIQTANPTANYFIGIIEDIHIEKEYEDTVKKQNEELETIFNSTLDGIAVVDSDTKFINCNEAFCTLTGYSKEELFTKTCTELTQEKDKTKNLEAIKETIEFGYTKNIEKSCTTKDGQNLEVNMSLSLLPDKEHILVVIHDLTVYKMMQEQSRLASMGEMIGNIAHQWRQPLSIITSSATGILYYRDSNMLNNEILDKEMNAINNQAQYLSNTIDDFRNFIKGETVFNNFSVKKLLESTFTLIEASLKNNYIHIIKDIDDDMIIFGSLNELEQALINIFNNAKDILKTQDEDSRLIKVSTKKISDTKISITIHDTGNGIPDNIKDKIFDPYFTTKHQSQGTGIGLSMVDKIIRQRHNQSLSVENKYFEYNDKKYFGASFTIVFDTTKEMELDNG